MSQQPYWPPNQGQPLGYYSQTPYADPFKPARRAGVMMFILGGLFLICGGCNLISGLIPANPEATRDQFRPWVGDAVEEMRIPSQAENFIVGGTQFIAAIALLALAVPVRQGNRQATTGAIVATVVLMLALLVPQVISAVAMGSPTMIAGTVCGIVILWIPFILLLAWLAQAMRVTGTAEQWAAYQQQYWQYMQSQAYGQGAYGPPGGAPMPPPPPGQPPVQPYPASPPPPPPPPPHDGDVR